MFNTNEYFEGKVKSISFHTGHGTATVGVMAAGEYEFGTTSVEHMTVTSGKMDVQLPGDDAWNTYEPYETFTIDKDVKFKVRVKGDTSYRCLYK